MADNVTANAGAGGATFATDDVAGVHYPLSKIAWGPLDTVNVTDDAVGKRFPVVVGAALPAGTNNIGDVDVLTVPAPLSTVGTGTEAGVLRVTIATDSTGVLSVDDNGGSLTVDGTVSINAIPAGTNNIGDVDVLTLPGVAGDIAHDGVDSGNPLKVGAKARTADPTAVAAADRVDVMADTLGKPVVLVGATHDRHTEGRGTFTTTTAADLIALVASTRIAITSVLVTNAHATVATKVEIRDGTTVKIQGHAAAVGGGFALASAHPLFISTAGAAVTGRCVTTGADVDIFVSGYLIAN